MQVPGHLWLASLTLVGCYKVNYNTSLAAGASPDETVWEHRAIGGIVELNPVDTGDVCSGGVAKIHTEVSLLNGLASRAPALVGIPSFLYTPGTVQVWCGEGGAVSAPAVSDPVDAAVPSGAVSAEAAAPAVEAPAALPADAAPAVEESAGDDEVPADPPAPKESDGADWLQDQ